MQAVGKRFWVLMCILALSVNLVIAPITAALSGDQSENQGTGANLEDPLLGTEPSETDDESDGIDQEVDTTVDPTTPGENTTLITSGQIVISRIQAGNQSDSNQELIELYNQTDHDIELTGLWLRFITTTEAGAVGSSKPSVDLSGQVLGARSYLIVANQKYVDIPETAIKAFSGNKITLNGVAELKHESGENITVIDSVGIGDAHSFKMKAATIDNKLSIGRCMTENGTLLDAGNNSLDFLFYETLEFGQYYACENEPDEDESGDESESPLDDEPMNRCESLKLNEIGANLDKGQFIEVMNSGDETISLLGCSLGTNRSQIKVYDFSDLDLAPGELLAINVDDTELVLTKEPTKSGSVYIYDSADNEVDDVSYQKHRKGSSWSLIDDEWVGTFAVTPGASNQYMQWPACESGWERNDVTGLCNKIVETTTLGACPDGQYRSVETNRCRKLVPQSADLVPCEPDQERNPLTNRCRRITLASAVLQPCSVGQERNPATNRCRSVASASSVLKPCDVGQERNPATNRCRSVKAASNTLKACAEGQERNPETNRCRKVKGAVPAKAGFAVEEIQDVASATIGWWAVGGVGILAAGYAVWEWRAEVGRLIQRVRGHDTSSK